MKAETQPKNQDTIYLRKETLYAQPRLYAISYHHSLKPQISQKNKTKGRFSNYCIMYYQVHKHLKSTLLIKRWLTFSNCGSYCYSSYNL